MERDSQRRRVGVGRRAQSVFDFSIGVSLFLIVVIGVLAFVPTAFDSFTAGAGGGAGDGSAAERAADYLAESALAPTFDTDCTLLLFTRTTGRSDIAVTPGDCGFEQGTELASNASVDERDIAVNVTVERRKPADPGRERLCWNADAGLFDDRLTSVGNADCDPSSSEDVALTAGASAANNGNYAVAERFGRLGEEGVYLVVRVW